MFANLGPPPPGPPGSGGGGPPPPVGMTSSSGLMGGPPAGPPPGGPPPPAMGMGLGMGGSPPPPASTPPPLSPVPPSMVGGPPPGPPPPAMGLDAGPPPAAFGAPPAGPPPSGPPPSGPPPPVAMGMGAPPPQFGAPPAGPPPGAPPPASPGSPKMPVTAPPPGSMGGPPTGMPQGFMGLGRPPAGPPGGAIPGGPPPGAGPPRGAPPALGGPPGAAGAPVGGPPPAGFPNLGAPPRGFPSANPMQAQAAIAAQAAARSRTPTDAGSVASHQSAGSASQRQQPGVFQGLPGAQRRPEADGGSDAGSVGGPGAGSRSVNSIASSLSLQPTSPSIISRGSTGAARISRPPEGHNPTRAIMSRPKRRTLGKRIPSKLRLQIENLRSDGDQKVVPIAQPLAVVEEPAEEPLLKQLDVRYHHDEEWASFKLDIEGTALNLSSKEHEDLSLDLRRAKLRRASAEGENCFSLESGSTSLVFRCPTTEVRSRWMEELLTAPTRKPPASGASSKAEDETKDADKDTGRHSSSSHRSGAGRRSSVRSSDKGSRRGSEASVYSDADRVSNDSIGDADLDVVKSGDEGSGGEGSDGDEQPRHSHSSSHDQDRSDDERSHTNSEEEEPRRRRHHGHGPGGHHHHRHREDDEDEESDYTSETPSGSRTDDEEDLSSWEDEEEREHRATTAGGHTIHHHIPNRRRARDAPEKTAKEAEEDFPTHGEMAVQTEQNDALVSGHARKDLRQSHMRKPRINVRKLRMYVRWLNSLHVWSKPVDIESLHKHMCNGLLLCNVMQKLVPSTVYKGVNERPLTRRPAINNIEMALSVIWRSASVNNSRIPRADDVYEGNTSKICIMIQEIFDVYIMRSLLRKAPRMLQWFHNVLRQYRRPLSDEVLHEPLSPMLWQEFQSGTSLFCVLYHFNGSVAIGQGKDAISVDSLRVQMQPKNLREYRENVSYVFDLLKALDIEVLWTVDDWLTFPDQDFCLLQLYLLYQKFHTKQCVLPPAQGTNAGITSGAKGEPLVTGLLFADSDANKMKTFQRRRKSVLMGGGGGGSLPVLPVWSGHVGHGSTGDPELDRKRRRRQNREGIDTGQAAGGAAGAGRRGGAGRGGTGGRAGRGGRAGGGKRAEDDGDINNLAAKMPHLAPGLVASVMTVSSDMTDLERLSRKKEVTDQGVLERGWNTSAANTNVTERERLLSSTQREANQDILADLAAKEKERLINVLTSMSGKDIPPELLEDVGATWAEVRNEIAMAQDLATTKYELEVEMKEAEQDLERKEATLETKYLALEKQAGMINANSYDSRLEELERERAELEGERNMLHSRFAGRQRALQQQHEEAKNKAKFTAIDQHITEHSQRLKAGLRAASLQQQLHSQGEEGRVPSANRPSSHKQHEDRERGWITLTSSSSHNQTLQRRAKLSETQANRVLDTRTRKGRRAGTRGTGRRAAATSATSSAADDSQETIDYGLTDDDLAWERFRSKLQREQQRWVQKSEQQNVARLRRLQQDRVPSAGMLPGESADALEESADAVQLEEVKKAIRREELRLMQIEEERRYLVIHQEAQRTKMVLDYASLTNRGPDYGMAGMAGAGGGNGRGRPTSGRDSMVDTGMMAGAPIASPRSRQSAMPANMPPGAMALPSQVPAVAEPSLANRQPVRQSIRNDGTAMGAGGGNGAGLVASRFADPTQTAMAALGTGAASFGARRDQLKQQSGQQQSQQQQGYPEDDVNDDAVMEKMAADMRPGPGMELVSRRGTTTQAAAGTAAAMQATAVAAAVPAVGGGAAGAGVGANAAGTTAPSSRPEDILQSRLGGGAVANPAAQQPSPRSNRGPAPGGSRNMPVAQRPEELAASLRWLAIPRTLSMKERNSERQYEFSVVHGSLVAPGDDVRKNSYVLRWCNPGTSFTVGFIAVCDMSEVRVTEQDQSTFTVVLQSRNPQAVRNSGGRPMISVKCNSFQECAKYRIGLHTLLSL